MRIVHRSRLLDWINRVVTSKDTVLLICLNQRSGVKRILQQSSKGRKSKGAGTKVGLTFRPRMEVGT